MKAKKLMMIAAVIASFVLLFAACNEDEPDPEYEIGPGGGIIFYHSETGFIVYQDADDTTGVLCHYLEAAPADMSAKLAWHSFGNTGHLIPGEFGTVIGTGKKNTDLILAEDSSAYAAKACREYSNKGYTDWFLPSKDELYALWQLYSDNGRGNYANLKQSEAYWSSTQFTGDYPISSARGAWDQNFNFSGTQDPINKEFSYYVRAIRAFNKE